MSSDDCTERFEDWFKVFSRYPGGFQRLHQFVAIFSRRDPVSKEFELAVHQMYELMRLSFAAGYEFGVADEAFECRVECRRGLDEEQ